MNVYYLAFEKQVGRDQSKESVMNTVQDVLVTRRYLVTGAKRVSNYWWAFIVSSGGLAFFITGFASFLQKNILIFNQSKTISFFPQGLIMCFYGCLGLLFGSYLWCTIFWEVGGGFNEFNKNQGFVRIFRWGLPGKNRRIDFQYKINEIEGILVELKEGVNPRRVISLKVKALPSPNRVVNSDKPTINNKRAQDQGKRDAFTVPLTRVGQPISLEKIESQASELAQFLQVSLETSYLDS